MPRGIVLLVACFTAAAAAAVALALRDGSGSGRTVQRACAPDEREWHIVARAGVPALAGVAAPGGGDVWAVGRSGTRAVVTRLHGRALRTHVFPWKEARLTAVSASSPSDVWAVGTMGHRRSLPLVVHWDGRVWARVRLPGSSRMLFSDVAALAPDDVWVVGDAVLHWDGLRWTSQRARALSGEDDSWIAAVDAVSAKNVWAVGSIGEWNPVGWEDDSDLVVHWDGSGWSTVASLKETTGYPMYGRGLDATASGQAWTIATPVMGSMLLGHWSNAAAQPESLGWRNGYDPMNGGTSHQSEVGSVGDVVALAPDDVWTAGAGTSLAHWGGTTWESVGSSAGELTVDDAWHLTALARSGATDIWAVGNGIVARLSC